jgi:tetratricopeptide (TPR) repeat protein
MEIGGHVVNRYRVERLIGRGGAAFVYEVTDDQTGLRLAMKRLAMDDARRSQAWVLFQREYHTLSQLSHPLIIRAYDYGLDAGVPYYTMELLTGKDLRTLGQRPWREACSLARDVASALAIVHSRRLLHRDVTLRNVCETEDGHAKLLDFGALAPMGPCRDVVGTPSFIAPESLEEEALDGRADLFSLGACLYFLLSGRHAFPARKVADLADAWRRTPATPSFFAKDVPAALDDLVLSLLSLNPSARPQSAAELFERLTSLAELTATEAPEVARSYLLTPTLVGREAAVDRFSRRVTRAQRGRGGALLIEAHSGLGRSRLLASLLLDAKLRGVLTVRANGEAEARPFSAIAEAARVLVRDDPALGREAAGSDAGLLSPLLFGEANDAVPDPEAWGKVAEACTRFFVNVTKKSPLVVAVDDFDTCDEQSTSVLLRLASHSPSLALIVVASCRRDARSPAVERFRSSASALALRPMSASETRLLLSSVFGEVPNIDAVAQWIHHVSEGSPRASLEIAQHFVDRGLAAYHDGSWTLPVSPEELGLPASLGQALDVRVASLGPVARTLAETLALVSDFAPLSVVEYPALLGGAEPGRLFEALAELVASSVLVERGSTYAFAHSEIKDAVFRGIAPGHEVALHAILATTFAARSDGAPEIVAHHSFLAQNPEMAFEYAVRAVESARIEHHQFARSAPSIAVFDEIFQWGRVHRSTTAGLMIIGRRILQLGSSVDVSLARHGDFLVERLRRDVGLDRWEEYAGIPDPLERIRVCIGAAMERFDATPEAERGLAPLAAVQELAISVAMLTGAYVRELDPRKSLALVPILEPLRPLSPTVDVVAEVTAYAADSLTGVSISKRRLQAIERLSVPLPGLDDLTRVGMFLTNVYYSVMESTPTARPGVESRVAALDQYPHYAPLAWHARMLAHLFRGEDEKAEAARRRRDLATLDRADVDMHLEIGMIYEGSVYEFLDDLIGIKRILAFFEEKARTSPAWVSYRDLHLGNYHYLRGDKEKAIRHLEASLESLRTGARYAAHVHLCARLAHVLVEYGEFERAHELAEEGVLLTERHRLAGGTRADIHMALAMAEAALGKEAHAVGRSDAIIQGLLQTGTGGIVLVHHLSNRARIALRLSDRAGFDRLVARIGALCVAAEGGAMSAKHARLLREASLAGRFEAVAPKASALNGGDTSHTTLGSDLRTRFEHCKGAVERADLTLRVLLEAAAAQHGFLYLLQNARFGLVATTPGDLPPIELEEQLSERLSEDQNETTATVDTGEQVVPDSSSSFELFELFGGGTGEPLLVGVAALSRGGTRPRPITQDLLHALGDGLLEAGDVTGRRLRVAAPD